MAHEPGDSPSRRLAIRYRGQLAVGNLKRILHLLALVHFPAQGLVGLL